MNQLTKTENVIFLIGGILMVCGSGAGVFFKVWPPYVFAVGALSFVLMQLKQRYEGSNMTIRRLRRIVIMSDVFFLLSAFLMFANQDNIFGFGQMFYVRYIHNNWVVALLVASILQLYATHRLGRELDKEAKKL